MEVVHPIKGGIARTTVQPGSAQPFESAALFARVSGYLKYQAVDIGSRVKQGEVLAQIDIPELEEELNRERANLDQAKAEVVQANSQVRSAEADVNAADAAVEQAESELKRFEAERDFRSKQYKRISDLFALHSIEERLVDEKLEQLHSAEAGYTSGQAAVRSAREQASAARARVDRAQADVLVAKAKAEVAQAEVAKTAVMVSYGKIISPYDGVVTQRNFHRGAFIRDADHGPELPLLEVNRTDLMRIVIMVPERDVPFVQPGDDVTIRFDALPTHPFAGKIARIAAEEVPESRSMRVEVDIPNPKGLITSGMYGRAEILLESPTNNLTIPSACMVGNSASNAKAQVFVVRDNKIRLTDISLGKDTGTRAEVLSGLSATDQVVLSPSSTLTDGTPVEPIPAIGQTAHD
ncbi:MAG TPA: efflux RND transporter periplasmic adaptor subunit [Pirellulales bacterium]|nr:efflux RND transporter periplasmic adaptor subunit [Pirellulales bacterium]